MSLEVITIGDSNSADIELLWFHGYGANNWGFEPFIKVLNLNLDGRLHVIMPNAPVQDGKRSWYHYHLKLMVLLWRTMMDFLNLKRVYVEN